MKIPLNEFEQLIDEKILKKGLAYHKSGAISDFAEVSRGEYEAIVSGSEDYSVKLKVRNNEVIEYNCNCPYDWGPVCKHVVALIFHLQQDELELKQVSPKKAKKKAKSVNQQVKELLKSISHDELIEFVVESCKKDKKFRNGFLSSFAHLYQEQSKEFYQKQIHSILQTAAGRDGWINWSDMRYVEKTCQAFLEHAKQYLQKKNFENVFFISSALLEEMAEAFQYGDDSNGNLGYFVASAMELLSNLAKEDIPNVLKQEIFEYCISLFKQKLFDGWDWHIEILQIASDFIDNENNVNTTLKCLDGVTGRYDREFAQAYKLELLRKYKTLKEVEEFINSNISNSRIRNEEIEKAFESKNFERAKGLAKDGIISDEQNRPGFAVDWYDWLLKIALAQDDTPNIIKYARYRLIDNYHATQDYYQILKNNIEPEKWQAFFEEIIKEAKQSNNWRSTELIRNIYIKEKWWDQLFLMLKQNLSLDKIEKSEEYLAEDYSAELVEFYSESIKNYLETNVGRDHYQSACRYLRRMKKLGDNKRVDELIELFRKLYPKRRALMDELTRV